jgi:hypothetical protein
MDMKESDGIVLCLTEIQSFTALKLRGPFGFSRVGEILQFHLNYLKSRFEVLLISLESE